MKYMKQTILGAGGVIGRELAKSLKDYTTEIRLVNRNPKKVNETDELFPADLLYTGDVMKAVEGSDIVYLTAGLKYDKKTWVEQWPVIMRNVIDGCKRHNAKLVFFDNVYLYDKNHLNPMTEDTPVNPPSKKGLVRTEIYNILMNEINAGNIKALIARSADFYGPDTDSTSIITITVIKNFERKKKALWIGKPDCLHSFTFTPDAGKATALLGNTDDAYGQVWHLPTAKNPFTGRKFIEIIAREMGVERKISVISEFSLKMLSIFSSNLRELAEMYYQNDRDYVFESSKFEKRFDFNPTSYEDGIKLTLNGQNKL